MAFQTPITVTEAVEEIHRKKYLLPAIQREVVWEAEQIERLFDSLMRDYPIGSFLFWHVAKEKTGNYQFYEFMREYHEKKNRHNPKANVSGQDDIIGILDGQQRLTSLYIGLRGTYAYKEPRKRWDNPDAFPKRRLYIDLLSPRNDPQSDMFFNFDFKSDEEVAEPDGEAFWYKVGDILKIEDLSGINDFLLESNLMTGVPKEKARFANKTLHKLWQVVHEEKVVNYFLEKDESLDKVLNIFVRLNSGGTKLSYSDLLLSIASAQWKTKDAREEIIECVDDLNQTGSGFNFDKDFVLKSCLVLGDFGDIAFKVDNFNKANMLKIEQQWDEITMALESAVTLLSGFGYHRDTLTANYAMIPIAYYLKQKGLPKNFDVAAKFSEDRKCIHRWLILSLVKRAFGGTPDTVLRPIREVLRKHNDAFPLDKIIEAFKGTNKSLVFSEDDLENMLEYRYQQGYTFSTLALLYPNLDYRNNFHIDHIHPRSRFTRAKLLKQDVPAEQIEFYMERGDLLANLQLLEGVPNQEKKDTLFEKWLTKTFPAKSERSDYFARNYMPDVKAELTNFPEFYDQRRSALKKKLAEILEVKLGNNSKDGSKKRDWEIGDKVMAEWPTDGKYYPGKIAAIDDDQYRIHFDDGDKATVPGRHVQER